MRLKTLVLTIVVLAALSVAAYFIRRPAPPASNDARLNQPIVDAATVDKAAKLRISDAGKTVTLARQSDGTWRVPAYYDLPADFSKLSGFVGNLTEAKLQRLVTTSPERIARLEFKDTKIELLDPADKPLWTLTLGKTPEAGGGRFVRYDDEKKAYLANLSAWLDTEPKNWANAELVNVKSEDVAKLELSFPDASPVVLTHPKKDDPWVAEKPAANEKVKADKVTALLSSVGNVRFTDTSNLDDPNVLAAKKNLRTVKLTTFDHKTITIAMGRKPEEKKLKPPTATTDGKSGPAALGSVADLTKKDAKSATGNKDGETPGGEKKDETKPLAPEYETIPAGPVYAFITHSDAAAPVNALMQKRAFQIADYAFNSLPQKPDELFEPAPPPAAPPTANSTSPDAKKSEEKKPEENK
jgi:hypothetical protein